MICPGCDTELGDSEKKCPKCHLDLEVVSEETLSHAERIQEIVEKRRKAKAAAIEAERIKNLPKKKPGFFDGLGRKS